FWATPPACLLIGLVAMGVVNPDLRSPMTRHFWHVAAYRSVLFLFLGLCVACLLDRFLSAGNKTAVPATELH
ncbi:MAG: hypothetical protein LC772_12000, partial [Chloroflexi bacterium]|nr:hypothetical protein [Chloroflexota bacterium]